MIDEFRKSELYGPKFTSLALSLLANAGFPRGAATRVQSANGRIDVINPAAGNIADGLDSAITRFDDYSRDVLKLIPVMSGGAARRRCRTRQCLVHGALPNYLTPWTCC